MKRFSDEVLREIRNNIPMRYVCDNVLNLVVKVIEGVYRFQCPICHEMNTGINPRNNLGRCFGCSMNFNTIEIVMMVQQKTFILAVKQLQELLLHSSLPCPTPLEECRISIPS